ncbi:uncharacterized protein LOC121726319 isoform X2 [Aricia agestis]|uniref:uncharacterized protein LOC121726319 isoform X2 n=1 Tax=Aricia agestis TaxID=91739 RepID=UPI001C2084EE|nr:uncharacterized protein LOC121726319 isoform X2 [Aricia agestis]
MVDKLKEYDPNATRETVRRKINTLRTNRRKEMNKIKNSIESGGGVHQPNLWYYHLLDFLDDDEPDDSTSDHCISLDPISLPKTKTEALDETNRLSSEEFEPFQDNVSESNSHSSQYVIEVQDVDYDSPGTSYRAPVHKRPRLPKKKLTHSNVEEAEGYEDRFDIFGKSVAMKMRGLSSQQRLVAEKIINDTLFKAEMGILRLSDAMDLKH